MAGLRIGFICALWLALPPGPVEANRLAGQEKSADTSFAVAGRNRIAVRFGAWRLTSSSPDRRDVVIGASTTDVFAGLQYARFITEAVGVTVAVDVLPSESGVAAGPGGVAVGTRTIVALPFGMQWSPWTDWAQPRPLKPFVAGAIGPVIGSGDGVRAGPRGVVVSSDTVATIGGLVGGGIDVHLARSWAMGAELNYSWMADFSDPIGERDNYSGVQMQLRLGWLFGRGRERP